MRREVTGALVSLLSSWQPDGNTNTTKLHVSAPVALMTRGPSSRCRTAPSGFLLQSEVPVHYE